MEKLFSEAESRLILAATSGHVLTRFKLSRGRRNRSWSVAEEKLVEVLGEGVFVEQAPKLLSVAEAEKVFSKDAIKPLFKWSEPPIVLKPASDIAESVTVNCSEFMND